MLFVIKLRYGLHFFKGAIKLNRAEVVFKAIDIIGNPFEQPKNIAGITCVKDISYGEYEANKGDLYFKDGFNKEAGKKPIILYIHGGGFIKGDKKYRRVISEYYTDKGFYVFSVNYRMPPEVLFDGEFSDCVSALNYIEELAKSYNIDLDNVFVTGDSSGACQTAYLAAFKFNCGFRERFGIIPELKVNIKAILLMCGIYDVETLLKGPTLFGVVPKTAEMILGVDLKGDISNVKNYEYYDCISPANFINENWCPVFICWAKDDIFCKGQGENMYETLKKYITDIKYHSVSGVQNNHCYHLFIEATKPAKECMEMSVKFLKEHSCIKEDLLTVNN